MPSISSALLSSALLSSTLFVGVMLVGLSASPVAAAADGQKIIGEGRFDLKIMFETVVAKPGGQCHYTGNARIEGTVQKAGKKFDVFVPGRTVVSAQGACGLEGKEREVRATAERAEGTLRPDGKVVMSGGTTMVTASDPDNADGYLIITMEN